MVLLTNPIKHTFINNLHILNFYVYLFSFTIFSLLVETFRPSYFPVCTEILMKEWVCRIVVVIQIMITYVPGATEARHNIFRHNSRNLTQNLTQNLPKFQQDLSFYSEILMSYFQCFLACFWIFLLSFPGLISSLLTFALSRLYNANSSSKKS
jgi:hypothetical protein